jgi:hypothetical protein
MIRTISNFSQLPVPETVQEIYRDLLGEQARKADVEVWAYC